jgi:hypothetical protein
MQSEPGDHQCHDRLKIDCPCRCLRLSGRTERSGDLLEAVRLARAIGGKFQGYLCDRARPPSGVRSGWDLEVAWDLDISHGLAPGAKLYFVEAASNSLPDLFQAVSRAAGLVASSAACAGPASHAATEPWDVIQDEATVPA